MEDARAGATHGTRCNSTDSADGGAKVTSGGATSDEGRESVEGKEARIPRLFREERNRVDDTVVRWTRAWNAGIVGKEGVGADGMKGAERNVSVRLSAKVVHRRGRSRTFFGSCGSCFIGAALLSRKHLGNV